MGGVAVGGVSAAAITVGAGAGAGVGTGAAVTTGVAVGAGGAGTTGLATAAAGWPGGVQPGGGTKALLGSAERTGGGASADAITTGVGADTGVGAADPTATESAVWPGGAQPGGGTKALLGSPLGTGAAATTTGSGTGTGIAAGGAEAAIATGAGAAVTGTGAGEDGVAVPTATESAVCPGGAQPGGGTNALLGSPCGIGAAAATMGSVAGAAAGGGVGAAAIGAGD